MAVGNLPDHEFVSAHTNDNPLDPDAICHAHIESATVKTHGYGMTTQCGYTRKEHPQHANE